MGGQAPGGRIWMQALGNALDVRIHSIVNQMAYIGSYARKAAGVG